MDGLGNIVGSDRERRKKGREIEACDGLLFDDTKVTEKGKT